MIDTEKVRCALRIINQAHDKQVDERGYPFVAHLIHIAKMMKTEDTCVVALMHDILSTSVALNDLRSYFTKEQITAIELIQTVPAEIPFAEYVNNVKENDIAREVEIAFISYELYILKQSKLYAKMVKYKAALEYLKGDN